MSAGLTAKELEAKLQNEKKVVTDHFAIIIKPLPELEKNLKKRAEGHGRKGRKEEELIFTILAGLVQGMRLNWEDHEWIVQRTILYDNMLEDLMGVQMAMLQVIGNLSKQLPEESTKIEAIKAELARYAPILDEVRRQIDIETERIKQNGERLKILEGGTYH